MSLFKNVGIGSEHLKAEMDEWVIENIYFANGSLGSLKRRTDLEWNEKEFCYYVSSCYLKHQYSEFDENKKCQSILEGKPILDKIPDFIKIKGNKICITSISKEKEKLLLASYEKDNNFFETIRTQMPGLKYVVVTRCNFDRIIFKRCVYRGEVHWRKEINSKLIITTNDLI